MPDKPPEYWFAFPGFRCQVLKCNKWGGRIKHVNDSIFVARCDHCGRKSYIQIKYLEALAMNDQLELVMVPVEN